MIFQILEKDRYNRTRPYPSSHPKSKPIFLILCKLRFRPSCVLKLMLKLIIELEYTLTVIYSFTSYRLVSW